MTEPRRLEMRHFIELEALRMILGPSRDFWRRTPDGATPGLLLEVVFPHVQEDYGAAEELLVDLFDFGARDLENKKVSDG